MLTIQHDEIPSFDMYKNPLVQDSKSRRSFRLFILVTVGIWFLLQGVIILKNYQIYGLYDESISWSGILIPRIISFVIGLFFLVAVWKITHYFIEQRFSFLKSAILHIILAFVLSFAMSSMIFFVIKWVQIGASPFVSIFKFYFIEIDRLILVYLLFASFVYANRYFYEYDQKKQALSSVLSQQDYIHARALTQEINPHLMSNYLSGISTLINYSPQQARQMIWSLAQWTRNHIEKEKVWITLQEELNFTQDYLNLEKIRFGDQLDIKLEIDSNCLGVWVPMKILQPVIENAIKHGQQESNIRIRLQIKTKHDKLVIKVLNNGFISDTGIKDHNRRHVGLKNIQERLELLFPGEHSLTLFNDPKLKMVTCEIVIPVQDHTISKSA